MKSDRISAIPRPPQAQKTRPSAFEALRDAVGVSAPAAPQARQPPKPEKSISDAHGSARIAHRKDAETRFALREKCALARHGGVVETAYDMLTPHSAIFMDGGVVTLQLARRLHARPMPLAAFTNSLIVAQELMGATGVKVAIIGGRLHSENASLVGPAAEAALDGLWFDQLFLGAGAIGDDGCLYSRDAAEARVIAAMRRRSARTIVLAPSALDPRETFPASELDASVRVVAADRLSARHAAALRKAGVALTIAPAFGQFGLRLVASRSS